MPLKLLLKHADKPVQAEALLLGMAGLLDETKAEDAYVATLKREFSLLEHKYGLANRKCMRLNGVLCAFDRQTSLPCASHNLRH